MAHILWRTVELGQLREIARLQIAATALAKPPLHNQWREIRTAAMRTMLPALQADAERWLDEVAPDGRHFLTGLVPTLRSSETEIPELFDRFRTTQQMDAVRNYLYWCYSNDVLGPGCGLTREIVDLHTGPSFDGMSNLPAQIPWPCPVCREVSSVTVSELSEGIPTFFKFECGKCGHWEHSNWTEELLFQPERQCECNACKRRLMGIAGEISDLASGLVPAIAAFIRQEAQCALHAMQSVSPASASSGNVIPSRAWTLQPDLARFQDGKAFLESLDASYPKMVAESPLETMQRRFVAAERLRQEGRLTVIVNDVASRVDDQALIERFVVHRLETLFGRDEYLSEVKLAALTKLLTGFTSNDSSGFLAWMAAVVELGLHLDQTWAVLPLAFSYSNGVSS